MAARGTRRPTRGNSDKDWGPKSVMSRNSIHSIDRATEKRERQAAKREIRRKIDADRVLVF